MKQIHVVWRPVLSICLLAIFAIAAPTVAFSQVLTGIISGTVTDATQAVVPNAAVTIVNADTGVVAWHGETNDSGLYRAPGLPVGRYNVSVQLQGFKRADVAGINLTVDQRATINVTIEAGGVTESVTVAGGTAGQLATETSSLGNVISPNRE